MHELNPARYDRRTIALHWWVAGAVLFMWGGAHIIDWFPKGPLRVDARSVHIVVGVILVAMISYRIVWRATKGVRFSDARTAQNIVAKALHFGLYLTIVVTLGLGIFNAWVRGDDLFGFGHIPKFGSYETAVRHNLANSIVGWHRLGANLILALASFHALAALGHFIMIKDKVLQRMLPLLK